MNALPQAAPLEAAPAGPRSLAAAGEMLRAAGLPELHRQRLADLAAEVTRNWAGADSAPAVVVLDSLADPRAPEAARDADRRQRAAGARTRPKAFVHGDTVYLLANALPTLKDGLTSLIHEAVGHWGLRRAYGDRLDALLDQVAEANRLAVWEKARAYGLDLKDPAQRREAAEEVLAEVAQENRDPALVERLQAAVRGLLRRLVPSMRDVPFNGAELLTNFIAPVRERMRRADGVTRLQSFKRWFGRSKVVDAEGKPLVVYHGTKSDFEQFDVKTFGASDEGLAGKGFYFTYNPEEASGYALNEHFGRGDAPNVRPAYVSLKNPLIITHGVLPDGRKVQDLHEGVAIKSDGGAALRKLAEDAGHDGVMWVSHDGAVRHVVAWQPEQIRSAFADPDSFRPSPAELRFDRGSRMPMSVEDSEAFRRWFATSKVVDDEGKPLVVYHGTGANITEFKIDDVKHAQAYGRGIYFTSNADYADTFAYGDQPNIMPAYVALQNPLVVEIRTAEFKAAFPPDSAPDSITAAAKVKGHDGIIIRTPLRGGGYSLEIVAFEPSQVKSAIGNRGTFDASSPDLRFHRAEKYSPPSAAEPGAAFDRWFANSKVVGRDDKPLVVYHGTAGDFKDFDIPRDSLGAWFIDDAGEASGYAGMAAQRKGGEGANVRPVYLSIQNPATARELSVAMNEASRTAARQDRIAVLRCLLEAKGYDGIDMGGGVWRVFRADQVRSAIAAEVAADVDRARPDDIRFDRGEPGHDLFGGFADESTTVDRVEHVSSKGDTAPVSKGNLDSAGRILSSTEQALQNFWNWYSDSEMTTPSGAPVLLYHATAGDFTTFQTMRATRNTGLFGAPFDARRAGIFLTPELDFAESYLEERAGGHVMPVYANLTRVADLRRGASAALETELEAAGYNVRMLNQVQHHWELFDEEYGGQDFVAALKAAGYDGAAFLEDDAEGQARTTYVAFDPEQVKSALGNRGTWSVSSADVRFQRDEVLQSQAGDEYTDEALLQIWADLSPSDLEQLAACPHEEVGRHDRLRPA